MQIVLPKTFLRKYFEYLYYSILPDCNLWDKNETVIIEPICALKINKRNVIGWKLIDELLYPTFKLSDIKNNINNVLNYSDWSELDQVLYPLSKDIFELGDNPLLYPGERLKDLVFKILPKNPKIAYHLDGICHFHPNGDINFSELDIQTLRKFADVMKNYEKKYITAIIITRNDIKEYFQTLKNSKHQFIQYMMDNIENTQFNAKNFYPDQKEESVDVLLS